MTLVRRLISWLIRSSMFVERILARRQAKESCILIGTKLRDHQASVGGLHFDSVMDESI